VVSESTYVREEQSRTNLNGTDEQTLAELFWKDREGDDCVSVK